MEITKHQSRELEEQKIISSAQKYSSLKHDYDDCGIVRASSIESRIINVKDISLLDSLYTKRDYKDAFISLQAIEGEDYNDLFSGLNETFKEQSIHISKAETVFIKSGEPYISLKLTYGEKFNGVGSIDAYVGGDHFLMSQDASISGFYSACAAISDIGANGAEPTNLFVELINAPSIDYKDKFLEGVKSASDYCGIKDNIQILEKNISENKDMVVIYTVFGSLIGTESTTLTGLSENMNIYLAGKVGGSALYNYQPIPEDQLKYNLNPDFRKEIIQSLSYPSLINDVSDGVQKSLENLVRNSKNELFIEVFDEDLKKAAYNKDVTLDHIKFGGDDYALVIATHNIISLDGVVKIGTVRKK